MVFYFFIEYNYFMQSITSIIEAKKNQANQVNEKTRYTSREFQAFGFLLSKKLENESYKSLYITLAKHIPRPILEEALRYVIDSRCNFKGQLFMWKLKKMGTFEKYHVPMGRKKKDKKEEQISLFDFKFEKT